MDTSVNEEKVELREDWRAEFENLKNVDLDDLKFIFAQAEKRLDDTIKNFDVTTSKSISFITLTATLLTALTAYLFVNFDPKGVFDPKLCTVGVCCIYAAVILFRFIDIVLPKSYDPMGSFPQDLLVDHMFTDEDADAKATLQNLYLNEIENYNCRIIRNRTVNAQRLKIFNDSAERICYLPLVGIAVYSLLLFFLSSLLLSL
ncbi:hypothetical protein [Fibrisoma limi]|uniref:hypothetical protein n=1 Tax=Fibrisoma limi TaxID=663275 RepID=UPI00030F38D2|nr:hypothetical protein [Fibrisoma limi]